MSRIIRNTLLQYIPEKFEVEKSVNPLRVFDFNNRLLRDGYVVYLCEREIRVKDNFALQFALAKSKELGLPLKIICPQIRCEYKPKQDFLNSQIEQIKTDLDFEIIERDDILKIKTALLVIDFNPILDRSYLKNLPFKIYEVDSHNIIPARFVSDRQEYGAATLWRKIYYSIYSFLTEFDNINLQKVEADYVLEDFIKNKLDFYAELKNNPQKDALETAIYLNDKYAYDAPSANGYAGILWSIGGLHDRAFRDWPVTGKIRRMTLRK